jgi:hypothetical protein
MVHAAVRVLAQIGDRMTLGKTIATAAAVLGVVTGSALAGEGSFGMNDSDSMIPLQPVDVTYYDLYGIDEDRDGVIDGLLLLEQSDTLA